MVSLTRAAAVMGAVAAALIVVGVLVGGPPPEVEGVYFNSSVGADGSFSVSSQSGGGLLDPSDGNLWVGAGLGVALATLVMWAMRRWYAARPTA